MNKSIPIGVDNFGKLINLKRNYRFVDKTLFIKEILDGASEVTWITRPRRWGKTLNLSMLEYFLAPEVLGESTQGLFDALAIGAVDHGRYLAFQGQSPVIFISFKDVKETQFDLAIRNIRSVLSAMFAQHKPVLSRTGMLNADDEWLLDQHVKGEIDQPTLGYGLLTLSQLLYRGFQNKKVYILIDEYDTPLNYAYQHGYLEEMTGFMRNLLGAAFKGNPYLEKGVMTGVLRISKDSMLSGLNNVDVHSVMRATYASHFGFSDEEVRGLFFESGLEHEMDLVRQYYNGYRIGSHACYNPWSIMQCLNHGGCLDPYWVNTADDRLLRDALWQSSVDVKMQLQHLISDSADCVQHSVQHTIDTNISDTIRFEDMMQDETVLWSLLLSTGYLTMVDKDTKHLSIKPLCKLAIPNQEVRSLYVHIFQSWLSQKLTQPVYALFIEDLKSGRVEQFTQKLEQYLLAYGSYHDFVHESHYQTFMLGLLCSFMEEAYSLYSNIEAGHGRADMILVPRDACVGDAIVMEFKRVTGVEPSVEHARKALDQIDRQQYKAFMIRYPSIRRVLKIGLVFNGKQVASCYEWEDIPVALCN